MPTSTILLTGGTGTTGRRIAPLLRAAGAQVRVAARGGEVRFDWDDPATHGPALEGADALYLLPPTSRLDHADLVGAFLDRAELAGVRHVTYLSARNVDLAPPELALRAIELDLAARTRITHSILRPGWFMQNFSEGIFGPQIAAEGVIALPTGDGAEAFVHAGDIADAAAATLLDPAAHAGAAYTLTGPTALTMAEVAERISAASGRRVVHVDPAPDQWIAGATAAGLPREYAELMAGLFERLRAGAGATATDSVERAAGHPPRSFDQFVAEPEAIARWRRAA